MKTVAEDLVTYYIGQNSAENDKLYLEMPKTALWFHLDTGSSAHVYAIKDKFLEKHEIKRGAMLVRENSKGQGRVIYLMKSSLKLIGQGQVELLKDPKYA